MPPKNYQIVILIIVCLYSPEEIISKKVNVDDGLSNIDYRRVLKRNRNVALQ